MKFGVRPKRARCCVGVYFQQAIGLGVYSTWTYESIKEFVFEEQIGNGN